MKKTLVALAALAVVGAASAQSSVTLYGRIDASIQSNKIKTAGVTTTDPGMLVSSGARTGSRWGMKGTEDLGGGMKAFFDVQNGFNVDTGAAAQGGLLFGRQAFVGLSGGFGAITAGRQYSPLDTIWGSYDAQGYTGYSAMGWVWNRGAAADIGRINNSLQYATPTMGGLSGMVMYAPGENKVPGGVGAGRFLSLGGMYTGGPLSVGAAYETVKATAATPSTDSWTVAGSYDLGMAKLYLGFDGAKVKSVAGTPKDSGWMFGAAMPIGAMTLNAGYAREKTKTAGVTTAKNSAFGIELSYPLSKRTYVYASYVSGKDTVPNLKQQVMGAGLVHNF